MRHLTRLVIAIASLALIGFAINAFAHGGMGRGGGWGGPGPGWNNGGYNGPEYSDQMSKEEYELLEQKREAFFKETQDLRSGLYEKERELQTELATSDPDTDKASGLQKEISEIRAQLDQKRIDHMVEMRKLNPNTGRGYTHRGSRMGYGPRGGYCWR